MDVSTKEVLQELVAKPIGSPALQAEAIRISGTKLKPSFDLSEAATRTCKKWLPAGKKPLTGPEERARKKEFEAAQIDLEDAVEAAGGRRGAVA